VRIVEQPEPQPQLQPTSPLLCPSSNRSSSTENALAVIICIANMFLGTDQQNRTQIFYQLFACSVDLCVCVCVCVCVYSILCGNLQMLNHI